MTRYLLVGAAALAMASSAVLAQGLPAGTTTSQTTTTTTAPMLAPSMPVPGGYNATKTERTVDGNGTIIDHTQTYQSGLGGTAAKTTTHVTAPDGSESSAWHEEWTAAPSSTTVTKQTTTTTTQ